MRRPCGPGRQESEEISDLVGYRRAPTVTTGATVATEFFKGDN
jgi:hypothetical protein